ncbi:hypothetical protein LZ30DRAFT_94776 [Colletotrichum cereale]|nr:hypothetical protein LZ30DRAFT_94776 [Colletotrichum cereale]
MLIGSAFLLYRRTSLSGASKSMTTSRNPVSFHRGEVPRVRQYYTFRPAEDSMQAKEIRRDSRILRDTLHGEGTKGGRRRHAVPRHGNPPARGLSRQPSRQPGTTNTPSNPWCDGRLRSDKSDQSTRATMSRCRSRAHAEVAKGSRGCGRARKVTASVAPVARPGAVYTTPP